MSKLRTKKGHIIFVSLILAFVVILSTEARAEIYSFAAITANSGVQDTLAAQLSVEVTDDFDGEIGDQVLFTFYNNGLAPYQVATPIASTIAEVYFDDGAILGPPTVFNSSGVAFTAISSSSTPTLPGGNGAPYYFETTAGFGADADPPPASNGVDEWISPSPVEYVGIAFDYKSKPGGGDYDFDDVLAAIGLGFNDPFNESEPVLRIGMHVISIGAEQDSDAFILTPVPGAALLGVLGLGVAGVKLRKFA
jgi:hypothetical protein